MKRLPWVRSSFARMAGPESLKSTRATTCTFFLLNPCNWFSFTLDNGIKPHEIANEVKRVTIMPPNSSIDDFFNVIACWNAFIDEIDRIPLSDEEEGYSVSEEVCIVSPGAVIAKLE